MKTFDEYTLTQIIVWLDKQGFKNSHHKHLGENVFEISVTEYEGFLSGFGYTGKYTVKDNEVICLEKYNHWMS